jgi:hypothetical protein
MIFKVESSSGWHLVDTPNRRIAHMDGVKEYGNGNVTDVSKATKEDIEYYSNVKGKSAIHKVGY